MQNKDKIICAGKLELNKTLFLLHDPVTWLFDALTRCITLLSTMWLGFIKPAEGLKKDYFH